MKKSLFVLVSISSPLLAVGVVDTIPKLLGKLQEILSAFVPFIIGLTILVVLWAVFNYITHAGEEEKRTEAKLFILWSIVGLFIMISIWGLVNVLVTTFDLKTTITGSDIPVVPTLVAPTLSH